MVYVGLLAAGLGLRMHRQDIAKPLLGLGKKPILMHTLEQFLINPDVDAIIIAVHESWMPSGEDLVRKCDTMGKAVALILGGENKTVTVQKIVEHIASQNDVSEEDILLIHDAVRPFVTQRLINEGIDVARQHGAACTVMETTDTIVVSQDRELLSEVPAKQTMLAQQTPQTFNLRMLQTIYENAVKQGVALNSETELVRLCIQQGSPVRLVLGEYSNMKIINPYELEVANALLAGRES